MGMASGTEQGMRGCMQSQSQGDQQGWGVGVLVGYFYDKAMMQACHSEALAIGLKIILFCAFEAARVIEFAHQIIYPLIDCILEKTLPRDNYHPRIWDWVQGSKRGSIAQVLWNGLIKRSH